MRRLLLASAAVIAIALAAPLAGAQYPDPAPATPPPYETQMPEESEAPTDALAPATSPTANQAPSATPSPEARTTAQSELDSTTPADQQVQGDPSLWNEPDSTLQAQSDMAAPAEAPAPVQSASTAPQSANAQTIPVDLARAAEMAGMGGVPMTAADVCEARSVDLASGSRLNRDARRHLINATDHASVCKLQRVVIQSPDGRGAAVRQTLVAQGVDESMIEVEEADTLGVEMAFNGLATSSEQYAAIFNPVQTAAYTPQAQPYTAPPATSEGAAMEEEAATIEPTSYEPEPVTAQPISYQPAETPAGEPIEDPIY